jgi:thiamine pyrophosphokinase
MEIAVILKTPSLSVEVTEQNVIYADAAYKFKSQIGNKNVLAVVGDFDSLKFAPENENIVPLNVEKDFTDGERAIRYAKEVGAEKVVIYGAYGGKMEHVLGNIALLNIAKNLGLKAVIKDENGYAELIDCKWQKQLETGGLLSLIPYGGSCSFLASKGLYYPLNSLTLTPADTRGISNVVSEKTVEIEILSGQSLVFYK